MGIAPSRSRFFRRGFTLVEIMLITALVGILATMSAFFIRRYLQSAKSAEARNMIGGIARAAIIAYDRGRFGAEQLTEGNAGTQLAHDLCDAISSGSNGDAVPEDVTFIKGKKYQPNSANGKDYQNGTASAGWRCLRFSNNNPQGYMYGYRAWVLGSTGANRGKMPQGPLKTGPGLTKGRFTVWGSGDLDGDSQISDFVLDGAVNTQTLEIRIATSLNAVDEFE